MSRIALMGASGAVGSRLLKELSDRGHTVTAIARHTDNIPKLPNVTAVEADVNDLDGLIAQLDGHDIAISAVRFASSDPSKLITAVRAAGIKRYLVVGGAASLEVAPGQRLIDQPGFPDAYRSEALGGIEFLDQLRKEQELDWTFLSPSAEFGPGQRTGKFRLGKDNLLVSDQGSRISYEDYAIALVDEIERPSHSRQRFTVGY